MNPTSNRIPNHIIRKLTDCHRWLLLALTLVPLSLLAQTLDVKGVVVDTDGEPIMGAIVKVKGTEKAVVTTVDGNFNFSKVKEGSVITASFLGMDDAEEKAAPQMRIVLREHSETLDEVLVVAFGKQKREAFTGSAGVVKADDITKQVVNDPVSALDGLVAGVQITADSNPTSEPSITIRGIGTINASSDPLIIVDGMPYNGYFYDINPADVENISVLKDAASNALYGARGANGVIIITTKNPQKNTTRTTFDAKWGANTDAKVDYNVIDNPGEYYEAHYLALRNYYIRSKGQTPEQAHISANNSLSASSDAGGLAYMVFSVPQNEILIGTNGKLNPNARLGNVVSYGGKEYMLMPDDWRKEGLRDGFRQEYNFNITGGSDKSSFYASVGYLSNEGLSYGSKLERFTTKIKADLQAYPWLRVGGNASYTNSVSDSQNDSFTVCHNIAPIYPLYIRDGAGNILTDHYGNRYDYGDGGNAGLVRTVEKSANSIQTDRINTYRISTNNFNIQGYANIDFLNDFRLTVNASTFVQEYRTNVSQNPYYGYSGDTGGSVWVQHYRNTDVNFQQLLNWNHQFGAHNLEALIGHEYNKNSDANIDASRTNVAIFEENIELDGAVVNGDMSSYVSDYNVEGYFVRAQYDYDSRVFASASFRRDGSSRFHPKHRWGNFWSVGAAWILTKESWWPKSPAVNMLKLKASYGEQGNDNISDFLYTDYYEITNSNDEVAILFKRKGNPNITWETVGNLNTGVEFELLNSRLTGSVEYYYRKTTDMLTTSQVPASLGYSYYWANIGDMVNHGFEANLSYTPVRTRNLSWTLNGNISLNKNRITKLPDDRKQLDVDGHMGYSNGNFIYAEGLPLYSWYIRQYAGVGNDGTPLWVTAKDKADRGADGAPLTDVQGRYLTSIYAQADYYDCGTALPVAYGGFGTSLNAYGFDLSLQFNFSIGGKKLDYGYKSLMAAPYSGYTGYNIHRDVLLGWSETNTDTNIPRWQYGDTDPSLMSDFYLTDASSLTFKTINFGYTLPRKLTASIKSEGIRFYINVNNVAYWTKRKGFDPRSVLHTGDDTAYSPMRTIMAGVNIKF